MGIYLLEDATKFTQVVIAQRPFGSVKTCWKSHFSHSIIYTNIHHNVISSSKARDDFVKEIHQSCLFHSLTSQHSTLNSPSSFQSPSIVTAPFSPPRTFTALTRASSAV